MLEKIRHLISLILKSGYSDARSIQENKKIRLVNSTSLLSGFLLVISIIWLDYLGVPKKILLFFYPTIVGLLLLFLVCRYISVNVAKFALIILINCTILLGGLISDDTPRLQQVLSTWIFSTAGLLLIIFDTKEWVKILSGCAIILAFQFLIVPVDSLLDFGYSPGPIDNQTFVSISFIFSMSLLIGSIFYAQSNDIEIYKNLVHDLQINNEKLRTQEEEIRQSYEELRTSREQIYMALETVNEKKGHLELAMKIAKMGSYHYYFKDDKSSWSEELKNLFEVDSDNTSQTFDMLEYVHPEDKDKLSNELSKLKSEKDEYSLIYRVITDKNNIKMVRSAGYVFKDNYNTRLGIRGVLHDITDYKNIEKELIESNKELENFIYRAYHDIKGPLATVKGICYVASLSTLDIDNLKYFSLLKQHIYQLETILSKLLIINELKSLAPQSKPLNIGKTIDEVLLSIINIEDYNQIQLIRDIHVPDVIFTDKLFLKLMLQNLLENSFEYKNDEFPWVKIQVYITDNLLNINVSDNGVGIDGEFYDKIFERYFRVSEKSKGTGLGLYIVKKLTQKLDASLEVRSIPYVETTFSISIPFSNIKATSI